MSRLQLTSALNPVDQVSDLINGIVRADGIDLNILPLEVEEIFFRFTNYLEWDVSEMSMAKYVALTAAGGAPMVALPVFTSRAFRHSSIYVRSDLDIVAAKQLEGCVVGVPEWAQTAGVWVRGILAGFHDVDLTRIRWVQAGVNQPGRREKVALTLPDGISYTPQPDRSLSDMLITGDIDAAISARPPDCFYTGGAKRLFPDFQPIEQHYHQQTGIFPIMHVVVMKRATYEKNPWIAQNLFKAFDQARRHSLERMLDITAAPVPLPWATSYAADMAALFNGDPWPYGVGANRATLDAFCQYAFEQGTAVRRLAPEDLFARETLTSFRV